MKKAFNAFLVTLLATAGSVQAAYFEDFFSNTEFNASLGFESETVYRGSKIAQNSVNMNLETALPFYCYRTYGGFWGVFPFNNGQLTNARQMNPFVGMNWDVTDLFSLDTGYMYYWFMSTGAGDVFPFINDYTNRQHEFYGGITADVMLSPAFYLFYNMSLRQWFFEPSISHRFPLEEFGASNMFLDFGAHFGWLNAKKFNGDQRPMGVAGQSNSYIYWGTKLDLTYEFDDCTSMSIGCRYTGNNDGTGVSSAAGFTANALGRHEHLFWWGVKTTFIY